MDQMDRLTNPMVDCEETIKHLNLDPWREQGPIDKSCQVWAKLEIHFKIHQHLSYLYLI